MNEIAQDITLTESNQELSIALSLVWRESENASQIIRFLRVLLLPRDKSQFNKHGHLF
jgi:hypothetical protein